MVHINGFLHYKILDVALMLNVSSFLSKFNNLLPGVW